MESFKVLGLEDNIIQAVEKIGFTEPTEIQKKVIKEALVFNPDIIALAHTGTGKTASFALPLIQHTNPEENFTQSIILAPTRELVQQIQLDIKGFIKFSPGIRVEAVYGGTPVMAQVKHVKKHIPHILVATPGRVIDLLNRRAVNISKIRHVVLDEADEMLNMGFLDDMNQILEFTPEDKKTWLFSATMPKAVRRITKEYMSDPVEFSISKENLINENIVHEYFVIKNKDKKDCLERFLEVEEDFYGVIFCKTRRDTNELAEELRRDGIAAQALNGELSQNQRDRVMHAFKSKRAKILVATDIAARGIDVSDLSHVVHYALPQDLEYYTHRSGRTARAGKKGASVSLINPGEERKYKHMMDRLQLKAKRLKPPLLVDILQQKIQKWEKKLINLDTSSIPEVVSGLEKTLFEGISKEELILKLLAAKLEKAKKRDYQANDISSSESSRDSRRKDGRRGDSRRDTRRDSRRDSRGDSKRDSRRDRSREDDMSSRPERSDRSRSKSRSDKDIQIFVNIGKMDRITKGSLVSILEKKGGIKSTDIGPIIIHKRHSTFNVSKSLAEGIQSRFSGERHRGRKFIVKVDDMPDV